MAKHLTVFVFSMLTGVSIGLLGCNHRDDAQTNDLPLFATVQNTGDKATIEPNVAGKPTITIRHFVPSDELVLKRPVNDFVGILSDAERQNLDRKLQGIDADGVMQIGVVIVSTTGSQSIFEYAMALAKRWQLGDADTDNGLLIVLAIDDKNLQILTGLGVEPILEDHIIKRVIDEDITPQFRQNNFYQGLDVGIDKLTVLYKAGKMSEQNKPEIVETSALNGSDSDLNKITVELINQYQRRSDLLGLLTSNIANHVGAEHADLQQVTKIRATLAELAINPNGTIDPFVMEEYLKQQYHLSNAILKTLVMTQDNPNIKQDNEFNELLSTLERIENRIYTNRLRYDEAVKATSFNRFP